MILTRQQKELLVIKLAHEGKSTRQIAEAAHVSPKDIGTILRRYTGEEEDKVESEKHLSINSKAFKLFKENKNLVDVAIVLDIEADEVFGLHTDYLRLSNMDKLRSIYWDLGDEIESLTWLYNNLKMFGLANKKDIHNILQQEEKLKNLDKELYETAEEIGRLNALKMQLKNEVLELMEMLGHCKSAMKGKD